jgi:hypothetical protein
MGQTLQDKDADEQPLLAQAQRVELARRIGFIEVER